MASNQYRCRFKDSECCRTTNLTLKKGLAAMKTGVFNTGSVIPSGGRGFSMMQRGDVMFMC